MLRWIESETSLQIHGAHLERRSTKVTDIVADLTHI